MADSSQVLPLADHLHIASVLSRHRNERTTPVASSSRPSSGLTTSLPDWSSWLLYGDPQDCSSLTKPLPGILSTAVSERSIRPTGVEKQAIGETSSESTLEAILEELETLALRIKALPIPRPPTLNLEDLCDALCLPLDTSISSVDTEPTPESHITSGDSKQTMSPTRITVHDYSQPSFVACDVLQSPLVQTFTLEDSGYASGSSSPAFSEMSYHSDIERTPRSHYRPRAPSPLTPVTPDFSSIPNPLPPMHSPYKSPELDTPVSPTTSEPFPSFLSSASQTRLPHLSTPRSSSLDVARQGQPSKTRFRPIKNLILNRKRSLAAKDLHVPLSPTEPLPRGSLDDPRSFLDFKMPKRGLRRRNSEDILAAHKAGGELEYESFLSF